MKIKISRPFQAFTVSIGNLSEWSIPTVKYPCECLGWAEGYQDNMHKLLTKTNFPSRSLDQKTWQKIAQLLDSIHRSPLFEASRKYTQLVIFWYRSEEASRGSAQMNWVLARNPSFLFSNLTKINDSYNEKPKCIVWICYQLIPSNHDTKADTFPIGI